MDWAPRLATRQKVKFWLDCLQVVTVIGSVLAVAVTFASYRNEQAESERKQLEEARSLSTKSNCTFTLKPLGLWHI